MLKIKEFADFCNVTVKTLQLYDKMNLFKPAYVDPDTSYRYYHEDQMLELNTILSFKNIGFKLKEIAEMKQNHYTKDQVIQRLHEKKKEQILMIQSLRITNKNIDTMLHGLGSTPITDSYQEELMEARIVALESDNQDHDFSKIIWL